MAGSLYSLVKPAGRTGQLFLWCSADFFLAFYGVIADILSHSTQDENMIICPYGFVMGLFIDIDTLMDELGK